MPVSSGIEWQGVDLKALGHLCPKSWGFSQFLRGWSGPIRTVSTDLQTSKFSEVGPQYCAKTITKDKSYLLKIRWINKLCYFH
jgi:hypothetical protein